MTNRGIRELAAFFVILFLILAIRQAYVQLVIASAIAQRPSNPRHALLDANRGRIVASDGTVLAQTQGGKREYPLGAQTAALVGYVSQRYGTSGIEAAFDRALRLRTPAAIQSRNSNKSRARFAALRDVAAGADIVTTIVPAIQEELYLGLSRYSRAAGVVLDPQTEPSSRSQACRATIPTTSTLSFQHCAMTRGPVARSRARRSLSARLYV